MPTATERISRRALGRATLARQLLLERSPLGVVCFASLGVALSHLIPNFEAAPAIVNAVFVPVIMISGVFFDVKNVPSFLRDIAQALPLVHLVNGLSGGLVAHHGGMSQHPTALLVLGLWTVAGVTLAVRGFSWEARRE